MHDKIYEKRPVLEDQILHHFPEARKTMGKHGVEFNVHCPRFHKKGGVYKLFINEESGVFVCQDCGFTGNAHTEWFDNDCFASHYFSRKEIPSSIQLSTGISVTHKGDISLPAKCTPISLLDEQHPANVYLRDTRGMDLKEMSQIFDAQYCESQVYSERKAFGRIVFPVRMNGKLVGWQARKIENNADAKKSTHEWNGSLWVPINPDNKKYQTMPLMSTSQTLYNFDRARGDGTAENPGWNWCALVEGITDVHAAGGPTMGTFGKNVSEMHIRFLKLHWETVIIIRDPDVKTESVQHQRLLAQLRGLRVFDMCLSKGRDPGQTPRSEIWKEVSDFTGQQYQIANTQN